MKQLLALILLVAGMLAQPLYAEPAPAGTGTGTGTVMAGDDGGDGGEPTEEEEEPDCE